MSAFVVDDTHIDLLVRCAMEGPGQWHGGPGNPWSFPRYLVPNYGRPDTFGICDDTGEVEPTKIGRLLLEENIRSVAARYPGNVELPGPVPMTDPATYAYNRPSYQLTAVEALMAIACWRYQSCETEDHEQTQAWEFVNRLESALIHCLPGYQDAPWEWTDETIQARLNPPRRASR